MNMAGLLNKDIISDFENSFRTNCLTLIGEAYKWLKDTKNITVDWDEETISANIFTHILYLLSNCANDICTIHFLLICIISSISKFFIKNLKKDNFFIFQRSRICDLRILYIYNLFLIHYFLYNSKLF